FYSHLKKGNGFAIVACVLESATRDEHALHKAGIEKDVIKSIMKEESIQGFAECVVAPSWSEGVNYIIQLSGIGGLSPNTVLVDWPMKWKSNLKKAMEFVNVLSVALAAEKSVLAVKGLEEMPLSAVVGTIDVWWMIHDGGFMILLSWLLLQHRLWRQCHIRIFTITEGVSEERAKNAAELLTRTLRQRRLFEVDVEVVIVDDEMIQPYTYDWTLRVDQRHKFVEQLHGSKAAKDGIDAIPLEIDDLFKMEEAEEQGRGKSKKKEPTSP
ncbi:Slc12a5, partial [Symbiodinium pilosum]